MLTDTHIHLDADEYAADLPDVLQRSRSVGVMRWIVPAIRSSGWIRLTELHYRHPGLFYALGLHPWFLDEEPDSALEALAGRLQQAPPGLVAIGECGLDAKIAVSMERQVQFLERQLELACEFRLPLILHSRGTHNELLALLTRYRPPAGGVLHAFSGSAQQGEQFYQLGFCLGIGGSISYERAQKTRKAVSHLPVESLLLETDGPTMPLSGYQGERNDPCRISDVFSLLATLRDESTDALACQLELNVERLFHLSPSAV